MANTNNGGEGKTLVATYPILFRAHLYKVGEKLPTNDTTMLNAWLEAGSAKWVDDVEPEKEAPAPKAKPAAAEAGLPGCNVVGAESDGENLIGKVPKTSRRKKV
jgi:hypothetical protein